MTHAYKVHATSFSRPGRTSSGPPGHCCYRASCARELHDETLQRLGGLRVLLSSARRSQDVAALHHTLENAVAQIGEEIANLRALITELRPAALDELGLAPALEALFDRVRTLHGLELQGRLELRYENRTEATRLDTDVETAIYRLVQESLGNAARHAQAERVTVEVVERDSEVQIAIKDDGVGFDPDAPSSGFGLTGMRERIALAGGTLGIISSDAGTTIEARIPSVRMGPPDGLSSIFVDFQQRFCSLSCEFSPSR